MRYILTFLMLFLFCTSIEHSIRYNSVFVDTSHERNEVIKDFDSQKIKYWVKKYTNGYEIIYEDTNYIK